MKMHKIILKFVIKICIVARKMSETFLHKKIHSHHRCCCCHFLSIENANFCHCYHHHEMGICIWGKWSLKMQIALPIDNNQNGPRCEFKCHFVSKFAWKFHHQNPSKNERQNTEEYTLQSRSTFMTINSISSWAFAKARS